MTRARGDIRPRSLRPAWLALAVTAAVLAVCVGVAVGPVGISLNGVLLELVDRLPLVSVDSGLSEREATIVWSLRFPRVVLGLLVGSMLALSGAAYQGVFRNPLADPYLLGVAAGAGFGATIAIVSGVTSGEGMLDPLPASAFVGALVAVALTYVLAGAGRSRATASLVLAGVAIAAFFTALQTFVQQRNADDIRPVFTWILGRLSTSGWDEVVLLLPYAALTAVVILAHRRILDVMSVGDDEATHLGLNTPRTRLLVVVAASLGTGAAVAVSGLIGFVGIIVPHTIRLLWGASYRVVLPLSALLGGVFLVVADVIARTALSPAEVPIGVVTAFFGAPFFVALLRTRQVAPV